LPWGLHGDHVFRTPLDAERLSSAQIAENNAIALFVKGNRLLGAHLHADLAAVTFLVVPGHHVLLREGQGIHRAVGNTLLLAQALAKITDLGKGKPPFSFSSDPNGGHLRMNVIRKPERADFLTKFTIDAFLSGKAKHNRLL
jgi:hypothetical protein